MAIARSGATPGNLPERRWSNVSYELLRFPYPGGELGVRDGSWVTRSPKLQDELPIVVEEDGELPTVVKEDANFQ